ncbi:MAG TPA: membrane-bound O-acyltransferase family protein [Clostridiales bacterium]|nr:membrane-bound O-acyltransferase family protein [Clostridiales bacterium]
MSFISGQFFLFFLAACTVYFLVPKKVQWMVLLAANYIFYLCAGPSYVGYILFTTLTTYLGGLLIDRIEGRYTAAFASRKGSLSAEEKKAWKRRHTRRKRWVLAAVLVANFGILVLMKYGSFFSESLNALLAAWGIGARLPSVQLLLPLGISFYTFQATGYLIDVYRKKVRPQGNLAKYALFVSFFPQVVQGPISRFDQLGHQLTQPHAFDLERVQLGAQLMLWGFFKKLLIADRVAIIANAIFAPEASYTGVYILVGAVAYTLQIYADFSGGMDIARGIAQILGIELTLNFQRPYFAKTVPEFWRRWHITLGAWFRDYVFYPLSLSKFFTSVGKKGRKWLGNDVGKLLPVVIPQFIVFFLIGVWHGASWKYVIFGFYHGILIVGGILLGPSLQRLAARCHIRTQCFSYRLFQVLRTFSIVVFGRLITRGGRFMDSVALIASLAPLNNWGILVNGDLLHLGLSAQEWGVLLLSVLVLFVVSFLQERGVAIRQTIARQNLWFRWAIYLGGLFAVLIFGVYGFGYNASDFIYRGF